jgi:hypothetical protein
VSGMTIKRLMLFVEVAAVCSECEQNTETFSVETDGTQVVLCCVVLCCVVLKRQ